MWRTHGLSALTDLSRHDCYANSPELAPEVASVPATSKDKAELTYRDAAVDVDAGDGLFDLKACGFEDPVLVAATDGVGTTGCKEGRGSTRTRCCRPSIAASA